MRAEARRAPPSRANLATGELGVSADRTARTKYGDGYDGVYGTAAAVFSDGLTFSVAGAGQNSLTNIGVSVDLHGSFLTSPNGTLYLQNQLQLGEGYFLTKDGFGISSNSHQATGWVSYSFSPDTTDHMLFTGTYALRGACLTNAELKAIATAW